MVVVAELGEADGEALWVFVDRCYGGEGEAGEAADSFDGEVMFGIAVNGAFGETLDEEFVVVVDFGESLANGLSDGRVDNVINVLVLDAVHFVSDNDFVAPAVGSFYGQAVDSEGLFFERSPGFANVTGELLEAPADGISDGEVGDVGYALEELLYGHLTVGQSDFAINRFLGEGSAWDNEALLGNNAAAAFIDDTFARCCDLFAGFERNGDGADCGTSLFEGEMRLLLGPFLKVLHVLPVLRALGIGRGVGCIALSVEGVETLDVALASEGNDKGVNGVVAVVEALGPTLDAFLGMGLALMLERHQLGLAGIGVTAEVERVEDFIVAPSVAEEVGNGTGCGIDIAANQSEDLHGLAGYVLALAEVALDEVLRDFGGRGEETVVFGLGNASGAFTFLIFGKEALDAVDVLAELAVALCGHEVVACHLAFGGVALAARADLV